jgi:hypothetical protein
VVVDTGNRPLRRRELAGKLKTPSVFGWRRDPAGNRIKISARLSASRFVLEGTGNAIREGAQKHPALNAAHSGGFRFRENVRMSLIQNGRGERI